MDAFDSVLSAARAGADWAWERIYSDLSGPVVGYLRVHGASDPEDAAGEAFLQVVRDLPRFSGDERDFRAWVFTIVHRRLLDDRRRRARKPTVLLEDDDVPRVGGSSPPASEGAFAAVDRARVLALLAELPPDQRSVLLLRIVGDMTVEEVARAVDKRPGAVKALQRRGLKRIEKAYAP
ncbi:MAG TPA: sigma-70 family RNA polymerase sigma factor [Solirubrobacteraceae bacterium]